MRCKRCKAIGTQVIDFAMLHLLLLLQRWNGGCMILLHMPCAGESLYPKVLALEPQRAGKITGMLLELRDDALLHLLANPADLAKDVRTLPSVDRAGCRGHSLLEVLLSVVKLVARSCPLN